jgi:hypothetical protein
LGTFFDLSHDVVAVAGFLFKQVQYKEGQQTTPFAEQDGHEWVEQGGRSPAARDPGFESPTTEKPMVLRRGPQEIGKVFTPCVGLVEIRLWRVIVGGPLPVRPQFPEMPSPFTSSQVSLLL